MLTPKQAFRAGFLRYCADQGMTPQEAAAHVDRVHAMVKSAGGWLDSAINAGLLSIVAPAAIAAGVGGVGGWFAGQARGQMDDVLESESSDKQQQQEYAKVYQQQRIMELYQQHAARARQRAAAAERRAALQAARPRNFRGI